jgi:hypothetical protein
MAKFYVGQRVRILYSNGWPELAGQEGRIVSTARNSGIHGDSEWQVAPDAWGTDIAPRPSLSGGYAFGPNSSQLEPILPDHRACDDDFKQDMDKLLERQGLVA